MAGNPMTPHDMAGFAVPFFGKIWKQMVIMGFDGTVQACCKEMEINGN
jgi:hypothetical protein